jgi:uncharacterized protein
LSRCLTLVTRLMQCSKAAQSSTLTLCIHPLAASLCDRPPPPTASMNVLPLEPEAARTAVLWGGLALGLMLGAAGQASRFCVRGAIADWYALGSRGRMASWVLAVAVALAGTQLLISLQVFDATRALSWSNRLPWASCALGGLMFGAGMVLAAGCPQRSLVKAGSGNLRAVVTLLVAAVSAQMALRGVFAQARASTVDTWAMDLAGPQDLGSLGAATLGAMASPSTVRMAVLLLMLALMTAWLWQQRHSMRPVQWVGSAVVGLLVPAAWWLTGDVGFLPEHPETLEAAWMGTQSRRPEALTFTAPIAHSLDLLTFWTDQNTTLSFGVVLCLGAVLGSLMSSKLRGEFRLESFDNARELRNHLLGGVLMGVGGVTALGCSLGQGVTGLAMLSAGSFIAVGGIVLGALLVLRLGWVARPA